MRVSIASGLPAASEIAACFARRGHDVVTGPDAELLVAARGVTGETVRQVLVATTADAIAAEVDAADARQVVGAGLSPVLGTCLAAAAMEGEDEVREVHVTYHVPLGRRDLDHDARAVVREALASSGRSWWGGDLRREDTAEGRRLAWFPRPVGPRHAVSVPLGDAVLVRRHRRTDTVSVSLSLRSALAEVVQVAGRGGWLGSRVAAWLGRGAASVSTARRDAQRWAVVVEVVTPAGVVRAWANGTDVVTSHAEVVVAVAELAATSPGATAVELGARTLLDRLADRDVLRWVVRRPD